MKGTWIVVLILGALLACAQFSRVHLKRDLSLMTIERDQWKAESNAHYNRR